MRKPSLSHIYFFLQVPIEEGAFIIHLMEFPFFSADNASANLMAFHFSIGEKVSS